MASVKYEKITKSFGRVSVIKGIDLDIKDGELVVFVGPSGCGKSTLLRMIAGLEDVSGGDLYIGETRVNDTPAKQRNIAMVFQNYALYPHMSIAENIGFGLKLRGIGKGERDKVVREAATILGIEDLLDRKPRALSGGQRQRVAMGRAIVRDPDVFLMDEPLSNLDAKLRTQMRVEIRKLQRRLGTTTIFVTHDQVEAMTLADRIAVLNGGYVQQFGTPAELYHFPINKFVAGFLGSPAINFIQCKCIGNDQLQFPDGQKVVVSNNRLASASEGQNIEIGIRPEFIEVVCEREPSKAGVVAWRAPVTLAESLGSEILVYVQFCDQDITVKVNDNGSDFTNSTINLAFDLNRAHFFSTTDGTILSSGARMATNSAESTVSPER
jgi:multiple sugar transport system ATP-binding protein